MFTDYERLYQGAAVKAIENDMDANGPLWPRLCHSCKVRGCQMKKSDNPGHFVDSAFYVFRHKETGKAEVLCTKARS